MDKHLCIREWCEDGKGSGLTVMKFNVVEGIFVVAVGRLVMELESDD